jgi:hypothetical protein
VHVDEPQQRLAHVGVVVGGKGISRVLTGLTINDTLSKDRYAMESHANPVAGPAFRGTAFNETDILAEYSGFQHGITCIPIIMECREAGILSWLREKSECQWGALVSHFGANEGHLQVAVRTLVSIGVLQYTDGNTVLYVADNKLSSSIDCIPATAMGLCSADTHQWLTAKNCPLQLKKWVDIVVQRWPGVQCAMIRTFLDGTLILPLLMALTRAGWIQDGGVDVSRASISVRNVLVDLFKSKGWLSETQDITKSILILTNQGVWISQRVLSAGVVLSYRPLLSKLQRLLLGNPEEVFTRDGDSSEEHVDRTLNVVGSGFQHTRYFNAVTQQVISIIRGSGAGDEGARYIVDTGCGDGTLLCMLHAAIMKAEAGRARMQLTMVGVDYNVDSLVATKRTCARENVPLIAVQGVLVPHSLIVRCPCLADD